jgi:putative DNA primase/helicase
MFRDDASGRDLAACARYRDMRTLARMVTAARRLDGVVATPDEFDQHPDLLVCRNGVVDLRTGDLGHHEPGLRLTKLTDVDYHPDITHPDVDAVLEVVTDDVRDWLHVLFGYAATGLVNEDVMPVFDGTGSNGKTTLLGAVTAALDEYACPAPARLLMKGSHDEHPTLIADLYGRRFVTIEETAEGGSLAVERMKAITGGSTIKARFMRCDYFAFESTHQLVVATNHRPAVNSTEHATWRRLRLVPFPHRFVKPEHARPGDRTVDKRLRERLHDQPQRQAMLAWIVAGAVRWYTNGLHDCAEIDAATEAWRNAEDVIYRFVTDRCEIGLGTSTKSTDLHRAYVNWCEAEKRAAGSNKELTKRLQDHDLVTEGGVELRHTNQGNVWFGISLRPGF